MNAIFKSEAFDAATRLALARIAAKGTDCFGEPLTIEHPLSHEEVIRCLEDEPMRLRQIAVRTQTKRHLVETACDELVARGRVRKDDEAFYFLAWREPRHH